MSISPRYLLPPLPEELEGLAELALDLRWSWSHATDRLWEQIDPSLWRMTRNPWLILQTAAPSRLQALASDPGFRRFMDEHVAAHRKAVRGPAWFDKAYPGTALSVAYFCMEFGLSEALPLYSGGLGILAGDHLKAASDLGLPVAGVGLLYQQGYFRQVLDASGGQVESYPYNDPGQLPILPVRDRNGEWLRLSLELPGRRLRLRAWEARVGRAMLYLLDSNDPTNSPVDRGITSELYGGGTELRLQQEIALGIGGWELLQALHIPVDVCHLNEGHAALAVLARALGFIEAAGQPFDVAMAATRAGNIFTTHTPVEAGFDRFPPDLIAQYLQPYAERLGIGCDTLLALGRRDPHDRREPFNMAYLALRGSGSVNAVSRLHEEVSRHIFQPLFPRVPRREVPITHVTNGVHVPSWDSAAADKLWSDACGKERWLGTMSTIAEDFENVPDEVLWACRSEGRRQLVGYARERLAWSLAWGGAAAQQVCECSQILDPGVLTVGFARRFAAYKRPNLLLHDPPRLARILNDPRHPVQLIIAGKAHPRDEAGKEMVRAWAEFIRSPEVRRRAVFVPDYDMALAEQLVQGVDLWINTPRRPWEACGTSGMKVLVNGGLNLSELDGWWAEAYRPGVGWALGDAREHDDDPALDAQEAEQLYRMLEEEVAPCFYDRDAGGIPRAWVARVRASMSELTPLFSSNRMLREYVERLYLPAAEAFRERTADGALKARLLCRWREAVESFWPKLHFGQLEVRTAGDAHTFRLPVHTGELDPEAVAVQLYADPQAGDEPATYPMERGKPLRGDPKGYEYTALVPATRPPAHFTPRAFPLFEGARLPLEEARILWYA